MNDTWLTKDFLNSLDLLKDGRIYEEHGRYTFNYIKYCYSDPRRFYHNLDHIYYCINKTDELNLADKDKAIIKIALYFHDLIYDVTSNKNEYLSALMAETLLRDIYVDQEIGGIIFSMIRLTDHKQSELIRDELSCIMLDIDLAGLGAEWEIYRTNSENIFKEYTQVFSLAEVYKGRLHFLETFLAKPRIFHSKTFQYLEGSARSNMQKELETVKVLNSYYRGR